MEKSSKVKHALGNRNSLSCKYQRREMSVSFKMVGTNCPNLWSSSLGAIEKSDGMNSFLGGTYLKTKTRIRNIGKGRPVNWQRASKNRRKKIIKIQHVSLY